MLESTASNAVYRKESIEWSSSTNEITRRVVIYEFCFTQSAIDLELSVDGEPHQIQQSLALSWRKYSTMDGWSQKLGPVTGC